MPYLVLGQSQDSTEGKVSHTDRTLRSVALQARSLTSDGLHKGELPFRRLSLLLATLIIALLPSRNVYSQTASTGALTGVTLDPSGATLPRVSVRLARSDGTETMAVSSDENGLFRFFLLPPGTYQVRASKVDFKTLRHPEIHVHVTETLRLQLHLALATRVERTEVFSDPPMVQLDTSALGRVVNEETVSRLPLVTRNFTQITGLSPGVAVARDMLAAGASDDDIGGN